MDLGGFSVDVRPAVLRFFSNTGQALWKVALVLPFRRRCPLQRPEEARAEGRQKGFGVQGHPCNWAPAAPGDTKRPLPAARGSRYSEDAAQVAPAAAMPLTLGTGALLLLAPHPVGAARGRGTGPASFQRLFSSTDEKSQRGPKRSGVQRR